MTRASVTSWAVISAFIDQPTTRRENWPAGGFVDTEIGCFMKLEACHAETEVQSRVQG
jgi:hypothetical protein